MPADGVRVPTRQLFLLARLPDTTQKKPERGSRQPMGARRAGYWQALGLRSTSFCCFSFHL